MVFSRSQQINTHISFPLVTLLLRPLAHGGKKVQHIGGACLLDTGQGSWRGVVMEPQSSRVDLESAGVGLCTTEQAESSLIEYLCQPLTRLSLHQACLFFGCLFCLSASKEEICLMSSTAGNHLLVSSVDSIISNLWPLTRRQNSYNVL